MRLPTSNYFCLSHEIQQRRCPLLPSFNCDILWERKDGIPHLTRFGCPDFAGLPEGAKYTVIPLSPGPGCGVSLDVMIPSFGDYSINSVDWFLISFVVVVADSPEMSVAGRP